MEQRPTRTAWARICRALFLLMLAPTLASAQSGSIDPGFNVGTGANNRIFAMAVQPDGRQIIGGTFTSYAGNAINRLARITRTGAFDNTFNIGVGPNGQVTAIAVDASGRILIGGSFSMYNNVQRARLARLNSDGTLDATFNIGTGMAGGVVNAIAVQADGKVIVVGAFTGFNGVAQNRVVRLNTDGSRDASYNIGAGPNADVYSVSIDQDGKAVIGGGFATVNGIARAGIARLTTNGAVDATFNPSGGVNNAVYTVAHQRDGLILIGGMFTSYNGNVPAARIARLQRNGTYDASFATGAGFNSWVYTIAVQGDGKVLAGGDFTSYNGVSRNRLVRLNPDGSYDSGFTTGSTANNWIYAITWQPEGRITAAGGFTSFSGSARNRIIRLSSACDETVQLTVKTDGFGSQTSWELLGDGFDYPICSGSGFSNNTETTVSCCVPHGPMRLRVLDSAGDGMTTGGYVLRDAGGLRIIDNKDDGVFASESSISGKGGFYLPMGESRPIFTACDKLDWVNNQFMVVTEIAEVSAQWGVGDQTDDGYEYWWFDPDGTYSQRKFRNHATSGGTGTGALRACHQRVSWSPAINPLPEGKLLNFKVRGRVNGVNLEWGPACRFKLDHVAAACPQTRLIDFPGHQYFSCGVTKPRGKFISANPVAQANKYEFEFTNSGLGYTRTIQSNNYHLYLNWTSNPLVVGQTYNVRVRASRDGGATFCPWGDVCTVTISATAQGGGSTMAVQPESLNLELWPNPGTGEQLQMSIAADGGDEAEVDITVLDAMGRIVHQQPARTDGLQWRGTVDFSKQLPTGQYFVRVAVGDVVETKRFVVTH